MANLINPSAYAKSKGLSRQAISQAIEAGRIPTEPGLRGRKMIDPAVADAALAALTDHAQAESGSGNAGTAKSASESGRTNWINTKTLTERVKYELLALELAETRGELIRKDAVEAQIGPMLSNLRDEMLAIGSRIAPSIVACKTVAEVARAIDNAIREAMRHVAAKIPGQGEAS